MSTGSDFNPTIPVLDSAAGETAHNKPAAVYVVNPGAAAGAVTIADGADVTEGALADAAVVTDAAGSVSAKLRGLVVVLLRVFALGTPVRVDPTGGTAQPVTAASLPLPAGAAIETGGNLAAAKVDLDTIAGTVAAGKVKVTPDALPANQSCNVAQINGATPLMGAGNTGTGSLRVTIASDQANVPVVPQAGTSGGCSIYSFLSTAAVIAAAIKASAGQVHSLHFFNNTATICYVRLYNMTTAPATTDTVVYRALIPANTSGAGFVVPIPPGVAFGTGIGIRVTAAVADNDNTALAANAILGNVFYA